MKTRATAGFTLLEVLIAVAILAISLTSLVSSQMASLRATDYARQLSSVVFLAEAKLIDIEYELKREGAWSVSDQVFEGDFSEEGWPSVTYICMADLIEMPEYQQLMEAKQAADTDGMGTVEGTNMMGTDDQAFSAMGMVWPIVKEAIEQSIRKSWCTVRWTDPGARGRRRTQGDDVFCEDDEDQCLTVMTFWTDSTKLLQLPSAGGEAGEEDDVDDGGGDDAGATPGGGGGKGGGEGGAAGGSGARNPNIPPGPGMGPGKGGMGPGGGR